MNGAVGAWLDPSPLSLPWEAGLVAASFVTSGISAALGIGGGLVMLVLMGLVLPGAVLIPVHGAVQFGSNAGRAWRARTAAVWAIATPFALGAAVGAFAGARLALELPDAWFRLGLGLFVLFVTHAPMPGIVVSGVARPGRAGLALAGSVTCFLAMLFGATGPLVIAVLSRLIGERMRLVATMAVCMTTQHGLKVVAFGTFGFAFADWLPLVVAMVATGYAGTIVGLRLLARLPERGFRVALRALITLFALDLVRRGAVGLWGGA